MLQRAAVEISVSVDRLGGDKARVLAISFEVARTAFLEFFCKLGYSFFVVLFMPCSSAWDAPQEVRFCNATKSLAHSNGH